MDRTILMALAFAAFCSFGLYMLVSPETKGERGGKSPLGKHMAWAKEIMVMRAIESGRGAPTWGPAILLMSSVVMFGVGFAVPVVLGNNLPIAIVIGPCMSLVPWIGLSIIGNRTTRAMQAHMEHAMGLVTNSYLRAQDIIGAIQDNVGEFRGYTELLFKDFLTQVSLTDSSISASLASMRDKTTNTYFRQWCTVLIQCLGDRELRFILPSIVAEMGDSRSVVLEADTMIKKARRDYAIIMVIACMQLPIIGQVNGEWYRMLTMTLSGQVLTAVVFGVMAICSLLALRTGSVIRGGKRKWVG